MSDCSYCGEPADTVDHVIPQAFGGPDTDDNKVPACHSCNSSKGTLPLEVWKLGGRERTSWLKQRGWTRLGANSYTSPDDADRAFYTKAAALRHEGFVRAGVTAGTTVHPRSEKPSVPVIDGLVGRWFHSYVPIPEGTDTTHSTLDGNGNMRNWQGQIVDRDGALFIAQLYSWWDGCPSNQVVIEFADMRLWRFFESAEQMQMSDGCSEDYGDHRCHNPCTHVIRNWCGQGDIFRCWKCIKHYSGTAVEL